MQRYSIRPSSTGNPECAGPGGPAVIEKLKGTQTEIGTLVMSSAKVIKVSVRTWYSMNTCACLDRPIRLPQSAHKAPESRLQQDHDHSPRRVPRTGEHLTVTINGTQSIHRNPHRRPHRHATIASAQFEVQSNWQHVYIFTEELVGTDRAQSGMQSGPPQCVMRIELTSAVFRSAKSPQRHLRTCAAHYSR